MHSPVSGDHRPTLRIVKPPDTDEILARLDWHLRGLRCHLDSLGMRAEAAAVRHELDMLARLRA